MCMHVVELIKSTDFSSFTIHTICSVPKRVRISKDVSLGLWHNVVKRICCHDTTLRILHSDMGRSLQAACAVAKGTARNNCSPKSNRVQPIACMHVLRLQILCVCAKKNKLVHIKVFTCMHNNFS